MEHEFVIRTLLLMIQLFQYCHQKDYTFKSSLFCVVGVWILVFASETFQIGVHGDWCQALERNSCHIIVTLSSTAMVTLFLVTTLGLVVAESTLPKPVKRLSHTLVHDRRKRNSVIFVTFCFMCLATTLAVVRIKCNEKWFLKILCALHDMLNIAASCCCTR